MLISKTPKQTWKKVYSAYRAPIYSETTDADD